MPHKSFAFQEIRKGDCTIFSGATFTLYANGAINWRCNIKSSDSGDEWDGYIICYNANNVELWREHFHFDIHDGNVIKRWDETRKPDTKKAHSFNEANRIVFTCNC
ncbi:hypothetical protein A9P82_13625 [Arachidicoccus ginsenosidimutans]|nr:hypothetical protein A9P82_13625 [Arachidicoccus sp. BS20]